MNNDELMHHGVLGMKWGVRHNPSREFVKASRKANKLQADYAMKAMKASSVSAKAHHTGSHYITEIGRGLAERRFEKAVKLERKANKAQKKATKWLNSMEKSFSSTSVNSIDAASLEKGKDYIDMLKKE